MLQPNESREAERQIQLGLLVRLNHAKQLLTTSATSTATASAAGIGMSSSSSGSGGPQQQQKKQDGDHRLGLKPAVLTPQLAPPPPPQQQSSAVIDPHTTPVWTAGFARRITPYQAHGEYALERLDWRGPKVWRAEKRLTGTQLEALRMMQAAKQ